jgi:type IV pilus assembly protein PilW
MASMRKRSGFATARRQLRQAHRRNEERGVTLVDVIVALVVASMTIIVVAQSFVVVQTIRHSVSGAADAHGVAAFALRTLAIEAANAGAGLAQAADAFDSCPATADAATTLRPLALMITDGGRVDRPDALVVRRSLAASAMPARFASAASAGASFHVEAVDGFTVGDRVIAASGDGRCLITDVTGIASGGPGIIEVTHAPVAADMPATAVLLSLGAAGRATVSRYDVVSGTLRSTDIGNGDAPNPLLSNVANLKFQYGIDSDGDGVLDAWVSATGPWSAANLATAPRATLDRIKALRIGVIARTEQRDRAQTRDFHWVLFDCELADKSACPGRLEGIVAAAAGGAYRYRTMETVVPLRNVLWNQAS